MPSVGQQEAVLPEITLGGFISTLAPTTSQARKEDMTNHHRLLSSHVGQHTTLLLKTHHVTTPGFKGMARSAECLEKKGTETL